MLKQLLSILFCTLLICATTMAQSTLLWGTTALGGTGDGGTIFSVSPDGSNLQTQYNFSAPAGFTPMGKLLQASDGLLYGTCANGGDSGSCTIYSHNMTTGEHVDLYSFGVVAGDIPLSGLIEGPDKILYGVGSQGGINGAGVIYSLDLATKTYTDIHDFDYTNGSEPLVTPIYFNGRLYGTAAEGGALSSGMIYCYEISTGNFTDLYDFDYTNGSVPYGGLLQASDGKMYGLTANGGANGKGVIFSFDPYANSYAKLYNLNDSLYITPDVMAMILDPTTLPGFTSTPSDILAEYNGTIYGVLTASYEHPNGTLFRFNLSNNNSLTTISNQFGVNDSLPLAINIAVSNGKIYGSLTNSSLYDDGSSIIYLNPDDGSLFSFDLVTSTFTPLLDFDGMGFAPVCSLLPVADIATGTSSPIVQSPLVNIYPDPFADQINVNSDEEGISEIIIYDAVGKEILRNSFSKTTTLPTASLAAGIYTYRLQNKNAIIQTGTCVKN